MKYLTENDKYRVTEAAIQTNNLNAVRSWDYANVADPDYPKMRLIAQRMSEYHHRPISLQEAFAQLRSE